jgi:hypothetical protein
MGVRRLRAVLPEAAPLPFSITLDITSLAETEESFAVKVARAEAELAAAREAELLDRRLARSRRRG